MYNHNRKKHPKYNDVEYHKGLLDEITDWGLIDNAIEYCEKPSVITIPGKLSALISLKNRINEVR